MHDNDHDSLLGHMMKRPSLTDQTQVTMAASVNIEELNFTKVSEGILGAEGPVFNRHGDFFMVAAEKEENGMFAGEILRVDTDTGEHTLVCAPRVAGYGGVPAGCQFDSEDHLYVADMRLGILKVNIKENTFTQVVKKDSEGVTMQGCNDCSLDFQGNLWVTAPAGDIAPAHYRRSTEEPFGSVYCLTAGGACVKVATGFLFSNGLAVRHDASGAAELLIVAETHTKSLWAFDITGPGQVTRKRLWGSLPGTHEGGPDGMDFDVEGRLLVANWGSGHIEVFGAAGGRPESRILCPFHAPSNLHFRPGTNQVYVTEHTNHALWRFTWKANGRKEACEM